MYISRVQVENIRGFHGPRNVDLMLTRPDGSHAGWTVLAGRNGSGKTTLLRAMALAHGDATQASQLLGRADAWISAGSTEAVLNTSIINTPGTKRPAERVVKWTRQGSITISGSLGLGLGAGYGPFRRLADTGSFLSALGSVDSFASLFSEEATLAEGVSWLVNQHLRTLEGKPGAAELKDATLRIVGDGLLPDDYRVVDVDSDGLWVERGGTKFPLREMSDGYRTVTALVVDIIKQVQAAYGGLKTDFSGEHPQVIAPGVVLIDEVDAHLHVSWQQRIGGWLTTHFPNIQFIVSTHSPYVCQAASPNGLIRLPGPDEQAPPHIVDDALYQRIVYGSGDDAALSELFGLDTPYSERAERARRELVELEGTVLAGEAGEAQIARYRELRELLTSSSMARVDEVAARLGEHEGE
jgi:energy-coupling factor transporter ATP-binding protein EcfA2